MEHAERNAIYNAARCGTPLEGCTLYVEIMPCMDCGRAIVQAGIREVIISGARMSQYASDYYDEHFRNVEVLFQGGRRQRPACARDLALTTCLAFGAAFFGEAFLTVGAALGAARI